MRVLLTTPPSTARLHHLTPLAWALRVAGHEVLVAGPSRMTAAIHRTGLVAVDTGQATAGEHGWPVDSATGATLVDFAGVWKPGLVIWDQRAPAGSVAARAVGGTSVCLRGLGDHLESSDLDAVDWDLVVDSAPESMRVLPAERGLSIRHVPYDGPGVVPSWMRRKPRRTRVYVHHAVDGALLDAVDGLPIEVICAAKMDRIPVDANVPDNVRILDSVPLSALAPTCSAVVHNGQPDAVAAAVYFGLPQLSLTAGRVDLRARIQRLTADPGAREAAQRLREEAWAMPSPRDVVAELVRSATRTAEGILR
jgi:UDP:flavonoid glycosyltransferase YjiC (YdhE family)